MTGAEILWPCSGERYQSWGVRERHFTRSNLSPCLLACGGRSSSALVTLLVARGISRPFSSRGFLHAIATWYKQASFIVHAFRGLTLDKHNSGPSAKQNLLRHAETQNNTANHTTAMPAAPDSLSCGGVTVTLRITLGYSDKTKLKERI